MGRALAVVASLGTAACGAGLDAQTRDEAPIAQQQVFVPGGSYTIGCKASLPCAADNPARVVESRGFWIDTYKVVIAEYEACVETGLCPDRYFPGVVSKTNETVAVEVDGAAAFCAWRGGRLPTGDEWEIAARGRDQRLYPWGNEFHQARISPHRRFHTGGCVTELYAVRSRDPASLSPFGVSEMVDHDEFALGAHSVQLRGHRGSEHGAEPQDYWAARIVTVFGARTVSSFRCVYDRSQRARAIRS